MLDLLIVLAFIVYAIGSGFRSRPAASQNLQEYFLAGKTIPGWKAGLSMAATQFAADTPLLVTGLVATAGIFALWRLWVYALDQLARHMKVAYGMDVVTEAREGSGVEHCGQRVLLFEVAQDLLLYMAGAGQKAARVVLDRQGPCRVVEIHAEGGDFDFGAPRLELQPRLRTACDVVERARGRLRQVEGRLDVKPDRRMARHIVMTATDMSFRAAAE